MLYKHNQIEYFKAMMVDHFVCKYSKAWLQSKSNKFQYHCYVDISTVHHGPLPHNN